MIRVRKLEAVLAAVNRSSVQDLRNRLQYLATIGFPPGLRVGSARRADYGLEEVFAIAVVFALARAGVAPATAAAVVTDYWPEVSRALIAAGGRHDPAAAGPISGEDDFLLVTSKRLPAVVRGGDDLRAPARSFAVRLGKLSDLGLPASIGAGAAALIAIDALYQEMHAALEAAPSAVGAMAIREALDAISLADAPQAGGGTGEVAPGVRLGRADFYFARAIEIATLAEESCGRYARPDARTVALLSYLTDPATTERWKMHVSEAGIELIQALASLSKRVFRNNLGMPRAALAEVDSRLERHGIHGVVPLALMIRSLASSCLAEMSEPRRVVALDLDLEEGTERTSGNGAGTK